MLQAASLTSVYVWSWLRISGSCPGKCVQWSCNSQSPELLLRQYMIWVSWLVVCLRRYPWVCMEIVEALTTVGSRLVCLQQTSNNRMLCFDNARLSINSNCLQCMILLSAIWPKTMLAFSTHKLFRLPILQRSSLFSDISQMGQVDVRMATCLLGCTGLGEKFSNFRF